MCDFDYQTLKNLDPLFPFGHLEINITLFPANLAMS